MHGLARIKELIVGHDESVVVQSICMNTCSGVPCSGVPFFPLSPRGSGGEELVFRSWDGAIKTEAWESQRRGTV